MTAAAANDYRILLICLLAIPAVGAALLMMVRNRLLTRILLCASAAFYLAVGGLWAFRGSGAAGSYFAVDSIGILFFGIMSLVFAGSAAYSLFYFRAHPLTTAQEALYAAMMMLFADAMAGVLLADHLALVWVFIEATTLTSAVLIYTERTKPSLEATWKYIFICSVGIALAFVGILALAIGSRTVGTLFFADLYRGAASIQPLWLKVAFAFILVGFGTKIGIAPMHAWLPDAHSEAPSPVSAMLSGTLLNSALLGLIRVHELLVRAGLARFSNTLLLSTGLLSLLIAAVFTLRAQNFKRMLAYSSIENMGILFVGSALGRTGLYAAAIHLVAHSLAKSSLFLTSGNVLYLYGTKRIDAVRGLLERAPATGWIFIASFAAIAGMPPFPVFLSKYLLVTALFGAGLGWIAIPFLVLVVVLAFGMGRAVFSMAFGSPREEDGAPGGAGLPDRRSLLHGPAAAYAHAPQLAYLVLLALIGTGMPAPVAALVKAAASFLSR